MKIFKNPDFGILLFRLGIGLMFVFHGYPKLIGGPEKWEALGGAMKHIGITFAPVVWGFLAMCAEFFGGVLLIFGLAFRPAAFLMAFTMAVAAIMHFHQDSAFKSWSYPTEMCIVFLAFVFIGPGKYIFKTK